MNLISRASWGARIPEHRTALISKIQKGTALHYSGADADETSAHLLCAKRVRGIQNFHMDGRQWSDIAYSYLVCKHGYTFEGRGIGIRTAGQGTNAGNDSFHAVCFLGDDSVNRDDVTDIGRRALKDTIALCNGWSPFADIVRPHSWFHPTGCPGDELRAWIAQGLPIVPDSGRLIVTDDDRAAIRKIIREELRILVRPDNDPTKEGSSWFDGMRRDQTAILEAVKPS